MQKKTAAATRTLHLINRLLKSERGLSANAGRQLYLACITSISDYRAEVWYKGQKGYLAQLQKIQSSALRKILGCFRTSPVAAMEIEANILPSEIRIRHKIRGYALRIATLLEDHPLRNRTPITYPPEYQTGTESIDLRFLEWNQDKENSLRKYPTQLIKILNSILKLLPTEIKLERLSEPAKP